MSVNDSDYLVSLSERLWIEAALTKLLEGEEVDSRRIRARLYGKIPKDFDPEWLKKPADSILRKILELVSN